MSAHGQTRRSVRGTPPGGLQPDAPDHREGAVDGHARRQRDHLRRTAVPPRAYRQAPPRDLPGNGDGVCTRGERRPQALTFLKVQLYPMPVSHVPIESPKPIMERLSAALAELEKAEAEAERISKRANDKQELGTAHDTAGGCAEAPRRRSRRRRGLAPVAVRRSDVHQVAGAALRRPDGAGVQQRRVPVGAWQPCAPLRACPWRRAHSAHRNGAACLNKCARAQSQRDQAVNDLVNTVDVMRNITQAINTTRTPRRHDATARRGAVRTR